MLMSLEQLLVDSHFIKGLQPGSVADWLQNKDWTHQAVGFWAEQKVPSLLAPG